MNIPKKYLATFAATAWIGVSESFRNLVLIKSLWLDHYKALGLVFPEKMINGALWGLWSLLFAVALYILTRRFTTMQAAYLGWFMAFAMMWIVIGNLSVLPPTLLWFAVPLSALEAYVAVKIIHAVDPSKSAK